MVRRSPDLGGVFALADDLHPILWPPVLIEQCADSRHV